MVSRISILQMRTAVVGVKQRLASFQHLHNFSVSEISVLCSSLYLQKNVHQRDSFWVLLPTDPSKNPPYKCHFGCQLSFEFPDLHVQTSKSVQLDSFHRRVELRFSHAQRCQALK